uniref:Transcriptional regulator, MarR family n=2 Tax=unclassified Mycobacterium TaxID=2642494 RepID=A0A5Q5BK64_MYCSS
MRGRRPPQVLGVGAGDRHRGDDDSRHDPHGRVENTVESDRRRQAGSESGEKQCHWSHGQRCHRLLRASEVVSTTLLSGASITKIADSLARRDLLVRQKSERYGRVVLLALTDAGRTVTDEEMPRRLADDEQLIAALTPAERETLAGLLRKVCAALGE